MFKGPKDLVLAAYFFAAQLELRPFKLKIKVKKLTSAYGYCEHRGKRRFDIVIARDSNLIETLVHEMIHVKQYMTGELEEYEDGTYWHGELCTRDYYEQPYEWEAFGRSQGLLQKWEDL